MGHMQPPTPVQTDNSTADGIVNLRVQPKRTKAMDKRFHWLRDREVNKKNQILLAPRKIDASGLLDETPFPHPSSSHAK